MAYVLGFTAVLLCAEHAPCGTSSSVIDAKFLGIPLLKSLAI